MSVMICAQTCAILANLAESMLKWDPALWTTLSPNCLIKAPNALSLFTLTFNWADFIATIFREVWNFSVSLSNTVPSILSSSIIKRISPSKRTTVCPLIPIALLKPSSADRITFIAAALELTTFISNLSPIFSPAKSKASLIGSISPDKSSAADPSFTTMYVKCWPVWLARR